MIDNILQPLKALQPLLGNSGFLFSATVGLAITLFVFSAMYLLERRASPKRRRLTSLHESGSNNASSKLRSVVTPVQGLVVPKTEKELSAIRKRLKYAGYRREDAVITYYAIKVCLILGLGILFGIVAFVFFRAESQSILFSMLAGAMVGMILPSYILDKKVENRQTEIINAFPDVLDLMVACTEAGLGLNAAIQRVANETTMMYPVLSAELETVNTEMQTGVERTEALSGLAERTGVEEISGFVSMIRQSVKFGTSIADTLRIYAEEFRDKRMQKAEETAAKVSTKLIFPLVLCIFPAFFAVAIGPAVISIIRAFQ